jgi:lambda family phage portal protein
MGILDLFRAPQMPEPPKPVNRQSVIPRKKAIEANEVGRLTASWAAANLSADEEMRRAIERTRARSRDLAYNNEYAKKYLQMVGTHVVGPVGFNLQALAMERGLPDRLAREAIELAFWRWAQRGVCEVTGRMSFAEVQRMLVESCARDGEALVIRRRGADNAWGYAMRILEIDRLPVTKNDTLKNGNKIVMGIELNEDGRAVAYWLNLGELDSQFGAPATYTRVAAEEVLHLYRPSRPEQHRGLPWMHPVMTGLKMLAGYEEAAITAARVGAAKMGFFTSPDGSPSAIADDQVAGEFYTDAEPGAFSVLPDGYKFESWDPDYPHQGYKDFVQARIRSIASGLGIAYHTLANDLSDVNFSSARAGTLEERDNWQVQQNWFADAFLVPVFQDWIEESLKRGAITLPTGNALPISKMDKFAEHHWQGRRWQWVDPKKDLEAARLAIKTGISSPQMIAAQNGVDIEDSLAQIAAFEARVAEIGVTMIDYELTKDKAGAGDEGDDGE